MIKLVDYTILQKFWDKIKILIKTSILDKCGTNNGIATLNSSGKLNNAQMPDDYYTKEECSELFYTMPDTVIPTSADGALNLINKNKAKAGMRFLYNDTRLGFFGYDVANGVTLYNQAANVRIGLDDIGNFYFRDISKNTTINIIQSIKDLQTQIATLQTEINELKSKVN